jgi:nicotinamidase-related amidase
MADPRPPYAMLVVDLQSAFAPPHWLVDGAAALARTMPSVGTIELHDETQVPFARQLGWTPPADDRCLIAVDRVFVKRGYNPPGEAIAYLRELRVSRVFVCGLQAETCVLAAGFALFDAGLTPTLIADLVVGSSLDRSGSLGVRLWRHHFRNVVERHSTLLEGQTGGLP